MKKQLLTGRLNVFLFLLACSTLFAQPYIRTGGGLGQYGYIEKDASATSFWVANGGFGNINQYVVKSWNGSSNSYAYTSSGSCSRGDDVTGDYNFGTLTSGQIIYSSVAVQFGGCSSTVSYSHGSMTPTATGYNERNFFVVDVAPTSNSVVGSACYTQANSNVVLSFTINNNNTASQILNRLWLTNDGTATETTDITNDAFVLYYEPATGYDTFNGTESSAVLYGNYGFNSESNNEYGHDALGIAIPQNSTGGLRCYVVLRGTSAYLNASAKTKNVRLGVMADGISITPARDSYSKLRMDLTRSSASYITINDAVVPTFTQVAPICSGAALAALPTTSNNSIAGTWSPALNNTTTTLYTFTPTAGLCATTTTMTITVNPIGTPTFTQVPAICSGGSLSALPTNSNNGYAGTWSPTLNNTVTTLYTFTPNSGVCANTTTMTITVNPNVTYYRDADNDTYGNAAVSVVSCTGAPAGYVSNNTDCDDTNINVYQSANLYADADGDGYTNGAQVPVCYGASIPAGYTATSLGSDCDDTNNAIHATFTFYVDADKDGFGTGNLVAVCAVDANTPPLGYALNNTDCNDADATKHQSYSFYADNDGDGRGFGALVPNICAVNGTTPPAGYSLNNTDCDDTQATVYPGAPEILYDGLDNNCNGQLDEGNQLTTTLLAGSCGTTLASIGSLIQIKTVSSAITGYRLRVTNGSTVQIVTKTVPHFTLTSLPSYDYATTYSVEVELQRNGIWLGYYGTACLVSSPAVLDEGGATAVAPSQCGITLEKINTLISTRSLPGATGYRFRVTDITNGIENGLVQTIDRNLQYFGLQMLAVYKYNATYRIEVAVKTTGDYSNYGSPCEISSPKVGLVNCDATIASGTELVKANSVNGATQYRFQITNLANQASTTIDRNTNYFTFNMIPGYAQGGLYLIRVAVFTANAWSELGDGCVITAPGTAPVAKSAIESEGLTASDFKATVAPNPFASEFTLSVTGAGTAAIELRVYDMIGKLVENRSVNVSELENVKVGSRYPAGVYNLIVTQGEHVKTLRVIKR